MKMNAFALQLGLLKAEQSAGTPTLHRAGALGSLKVTDSFSAMRGSGGGSQQVFILYLYQLLFMSLKRHIYLFEFAANLFLQY